MGIFEMRIFSRKSRILLKEITCFRKSFQDEYSPALLLVLGQGDKGWDPQDSYEQLEG